MCHKNEHLCEDAEKYVRGICEEKLHRLYGERPPAVICERLERELKLMGQTAWVYMFGHRVARHAHEENELSGFSLMLGSSFIAYLLEISDVNPLPAHYRCDGCKHTEFAEAEGGLDLPEKICPHCARPMRGDGHHIPLACCVDSDGRLRTTGDILVADDTRVFLRGRVFRKRSVCEFCAPMSTVI